MDNGRKNWISPICDLFNDRDIAILEIPSFTVTLKELAEWFGVKFSLIVVDHALMAKSPVASCHSRVRAISDERKGPF